MERLWEVDVARGLALILMLVFNWSYTLRFYDVLVIGNGPLYWWLFPRFIAFLFIFIVGVSLTLSFHRFKKTAENWKRQRWVKYPKRGLSIFTLGLAITAVTYLLFPQQFIFFGILHLIGAGIILATPFIDKPYASLIAALLILLAVPLLQHPTMSYAGAILGFSHPFTTFDYFPLVPWLAALFFGITAGHALFPNGTRRFTIFDTGALSFRHYIIWLGQHPLPIYLVHQPVLVLLLLLAGVPIF